jgi:hypothetical protein
MTEHSGQSPNRLPNPYSAEFQQLLTQLIEGKLTDDQFAHMDALLADDPLARSEYHRQLQMHSLLMYGPQPAATAQPAAELWPPASAEGFAEYVCRASNQAACNGDSDRNAVTSGSPQPADRPLVFPELAPLSGLGGESPFTVRAFLPWVTSGILGAALIAVVVVAWVLPRGNRPAEVAKSSPKPAASQLPSVQILSGTTKLTLPNIGHVVIDGPAEFDMLDPMRARLARGRIRVHVTEEAGRGFIVETPHGNVTDLGTEFGLDVSDDGQAGLVVFDGAVDLQLPKQPQEDKPVVERLTQGDGVRFNKAGHLNPIGAIRRDGVKTFELCSDVVASRGKSGATIVNVKDNISDSASRKYYEIVSGGLREKALVYVDRLFYFKPFGIDLRFLEGADYIKTYNDDRYHKDLKISVTLSRPAKLYVIFDSRVDVPDWLVRDFRQLPDMVYYGGSNTRTSTFRFTTGFSIWERVVQEPSTVELGYCYAKSRSQNAKVAMYSIAAVPLEPLATTGAAVDLARFELPAPALLTTPMRTGGFKISIFGGRLFERRGFIRVVDGSANDI